MKQINKRRAEAEQAADRKRFEEAISRGGAVRDTPACDRVNIHARCVISGLGHGLSTRHAHVASRLGPSIAAWSRVCIGSQRYRGDPIEALEREMDKLQFPVPVLPHTGHVNVPAHAPSTAPRAYLAERIVGIQRSHDRSDCPR